MNLSAPPVKLGVLLRKVRERRGETLSDVARAVGMQFQHLSKLERGTRPAGQGHVAALARYYGLDVRIIEARRIADEFWRENAASPFAWDALGILNEDAAHYGSDVDNPVNALGKARR